MKWQGCLHSFLCMPSEDQGPQPFTRCSKSFQSSVSEDQELWAQTAPTSTARELRPVTTWDCDYQPPQCTITSIYGIFTYIWFDVYGKCRCIYITYMDPMGIDGIACQWFNEIINLTSQVCLLLHFLTHEQLYYRNIKHGFKIISIKNRKWAQHVSPEDIAIGFSFSFLISCCYKMHWASRIPRSKNDVERAV